MKKLLTLFIFLLSSSAFPVEICELESITGGTALTCSSEKYYRKLYFNNRVSMSGEKVSESTIKHYVGNEVKVKTPTIVLLKTFLEDGFKIINTTNKKYLILKE